MPNPYVILTASKVTRPDLRRFIRNVGGTLDPGGIYDGEFRTSNHGVIFIAWDPEDDANALAWYDSQPPDETLIRERADLVRRIEIQTEKLGAPPSTYILIDVMKRNRPSERVALRFIRAFDKRWGPCVLDNVQPLGKASSGKEIWTIRELLSFSGSHGGLPE